MLSQVSFNSAPRPTSDLSSLERKGDSITSIRCKNTVAALGRLEPWSEAEAVVVIAVDVAVSVIVLGESEPSEWIAARRAITL